MNGKEGQVRYFEFRGPIPSDVPRERERGGGKLVTGMCGVSKQARE